MLDKVDQMLMDLIDLASAKTTEAKQSKYFTKDFVEGIGIIISLAYGRWGNNDK
jgi:hypothetical protein